MCVWNRKVFRLLAILMVCELFWMWLSSQANDVEDLNLYRLKYRAEIEASIERERGAGCELPYMDPFDDEMMQFYKKSEPIVCDGFDWVKCYLSKCKVTNYTLSLMDNIECTYRDILNRGDKNNPVYGSPRVVRGGDEYNLQMSDHVKVYCTGNNKNGRKKSWLGWQKGYRPLKKEVPPGRNGTVDILLIVIDSVSKNNFLRKMPKSLKFLKEEFNATILNKYHVVGDGTTDNVVSLLTGKNTLELPDCRIGITSNHTDVFPFIFYDLLKDGYETAYYEDSPTIGTFTYRLNGFQRQPTDHYIYDFYTDYLKNKNSCFCIGDTPQFQFLFNLIDQFVDVTGNKKFLFAQLVDLSHNPESYHLLPNADAPLERLLRGLLRRRLHANTLVMVLSDHGSRTENERNTYQGKLEERLPFMAIRLPDNLVKRRPGALQALKNNIDSLVTPYDIHETLLDAVDMQHLISNYKESNMELPRGISVLTKIPANRSCGEAGITPHWCACYQWQDVSASDPMYNRTAYALLAHINHLTQPLRSKCALRTLLEINWVKQGQPRVMSFVLPRRIYHLSPVWRKVMSRPYSMKVTLGPGAGIFEATVSHLLQTDTIDINTKEISRISWYGHEPDCINSTYPHLNAFCYCNDYKKLE